MDRRPYTESEPADQTHETSERTRKPRPPSVYRCSRSSIRGVCLSATAVLNEQDKAAVSETVARLVAKERPASLGQVRAAMRWLRGQVLLRWDPKRGTNRLTDDGRFQIKAFDMTPKEIADYWAKRLAAEEAEDEADDGKVWIGPEQPAPKRRTRKKAP